MLKKFLSVIIGVVTFITCIPSSVFAQDMEKSSLDKIPSIVQYSVSDKTRLVKRLSKFDNYMNAVGYLNSDGTETVYIFGDDIKYRNKNGKIVDKDISIVSSYSLMGKGSYSYETKSNDVKSYFPATLSSDSTVKIAYGDYEISMTPKNDAVGKESKRAQVVGENETLKKSVNDSFTVKNSICYEETINSDIDIVFETTYSGLKEDIVLNRYTGTNMVSYIMNFGSLVPKAYNGGIRIYDKDNIIFEIPPIYVEDSGMEKDPGSRFTIDNAIALKQVANGIYEVTIVVDKSFLLSPNTVYPVTIDPTITVYSDKHNDSPVYQNRPSGNWGNQIRNCVGTESTLGKGYFFTKFDITPIASIRYDNLLGAYYHCRELTGYTSNSIIETYMVYQDWNEDTITWNNQPSRLQEKICKVNVTEENYSTNSYWYDFYITKAVMAWLQGIPNYGLMFKERTDSHWKAFGSKEYSSYLPYLSATYTSESFSDEGLGVTHGRTYYVKNRRSGKYLTNSGNYSEANVYQSEFSGNDNQKWCFAYLDDGYYKIIPINAIGKCLDLWCGSSSPSGDENGANIQIYTYNGGDNQKWILVRGWNGAYRFINARSDEYKSMVVQNASMSSGANVFLYDYSIDHIYNDEWTLEPVSLGEADFFSFTNSDDYGIDTTGGIDTAVSLANDIGFRSQSFIDAPAAMAYDYMKADGLWFFTGHGTNSSVLFNSYSHDNGSWERSEISATGINITNSYYISQIPHNELSGLMLAVFSSCLSGCSDEESNLVGIMYKRGTHLAIAHTNITSIPNDEIWMIQFITALKNGKTIYDSMETADNYLYSHTSAFYGNLNQRHVLGDTNVVLKH